MQKTKLSLLIILFLAIVLRFWNIGSVPASLDWDEASLGYNSYSILHTGKDEYGNFFPLVLKSFGDYKPALYSYVSIPSVAIFGLKSSAVRFPSAFIGVLSVLLTYLLVKELFKNEKLALLSALILCISPWHIQFSRVAFEANLGLTLNLLTAVFFIKGLKNYKLLILSAITSGLSIYAYQSEKIFAPLFMLVLIGVFWKDIRKLSRKYFYAFIISGLIVVMPMIIMMIKNPEILNRARSTTISSSDKFFSHTRERMITNRSNGDYLGILIDNSKVKIGRQILGSYFSHFDLNWLFISGDMPRHHAPYMGLLYLWELPFIFIGLYYLLFDKRIENKTKALIVAWFFIAPLPASITNDVPHAVRTLNFLPIFQILCAIGVLYLYYWFEVKFNNKIFKNTIIALFFFAVFANFGFYLNQYFVQQNYLNSKEWQYGYKEAVSYVSSERKKYDKIVVSNEVPLDQSYIFFLFYSKYNPAEYQKNSHGVENHNFENYEFREINWDKDKQLKNILFVGQGGNFKESGETLKSINYLNGEEAIRIVKPL